MAPGDHAPPPKRKRGPTDAGANRSSPALRGAAAAASAAAQAAQQVSAPLDSYDEHALRELIAHSTADLQNGNQSSVTETAQAALTHYQVPPSFETVQNSGGQGDPNSPFNMDQGFEQLKEATGQGANPRTPQQGPPLGGSSIPKPPVGSDEWHRVRRDNHKEVERRRRETINEGITELARIVPGSEKNKGSILQRAVAYIAQLKENEQKNIEKWTLEKLLLDQAITELSSSGDRLKAELNYTMKERDIYKQATEDSGIQVDLKDLLESDDVKGATEV